MARRRLPGWARLALASFLLLAVLWIVDWRAVLVRIGEADVAWLLAALATAVGANLVSAMRWCSLVRWLGQSVSAAWAAITYFQGVAINALLPGAVVGGDLYRAVALQARGQRALEAGLSVLLDRISGLWMLVVLGTAAAAWGVASGDSRGLASLGLPPLSAFAFLVIALALLIAPALTLSIARRLGPLTEPQEGWSARLAGLAHRPRTTREYVRQGFGSALVQTLSIATLACSGRALGLDEPFWIYAVAAVPTFLMATLPVSFGGWGTREAAAALSLGAFGVAAPTAVAISMLYGLFALAQAVVGGGLLLLARRSPAAHTRESEISVP